MDQAMAAARQGATAAQAHALLGCEWGRGIASTTDRDPCPLPAEGYWALHNAGQVLYVRLCDRHLEVVDGETVPHAPCGRPGCPGCGSPAGASS